MTPLPLATAGPWTVSHLPGVGDLVIAFASIGNDPTRPPSPEFVRTATAKGRAALFVTDAARSWGTAPGLGEVLAGAVAKVRPEGRVLTMGTSMGAFVALKAAGMVGAESVLAIGPQYRPAAPWEGRWRDWTASLPQALTADVPDKAWTVMLHGGTDDLRQAEGFAPQKGCDHLLLPGIAHADLARHLKARGGLQGMIEAMLAGDQRRLLRIASSAGAVSRG